MATSALTIQTESKNRKQSKKELNPSLGQVDSSTVTSDILDLQNTAGNRSVSRSLQSSAHRSSIQATSPMPSMIIQRKPVFMKGICPICGRRGRGRCPDCGQQFVPLQQKKVVGTSPTQTAVSHVQSVLHMPGQPLDPITCAFMESYFNHDFSQVRLHTDMEAAKSAQRLNALAYTVGRHIVFSAGKYAPSTKVGSKLLAHELVHVKQQSYNTGSDLQKFTVGSSNDVYEQEADKHADAVMERRVKGVSRFTPARHSLQRACINGKWKFEYDGCSVPRGEVLSLLKGNLAELAGALLRGQFRMGFGVDFDKDNPAQGSDTDFALSKPPSELSQACDRHDECYQTCGSSRATCDTQMFEDMKSTCDKSSESFQVKHMCQMWAHIYFTGLKTGGESAFRSRQAEVCKCTSQPQVHTFPKVEFGIQQLIRSDALIPAEALLRFHRAQHAIEVARPKEKQARRLELRTTQDAVDSFADAHLVAQDLARQFDIAHQKGRTSISLRLGDLYIHIDNRSTIVNEIKKIALIVRNLLSHRSPDVNRVNVFFGDKFVTVILLDSWP